MSDDSSNSDQDTPSSDQHKSTPLGDNAGIYIPSDDQHDADSPDGEDQDFEMAADFGSFIVSLATNCMINLGRIDHPDTGKVSVDLSSAKHTIDILEMLQLRTRGNLDTEQANLLERLLDDLHSAYDQAQADADTGASDVN